MSMTGEVERVREMLSSAQVLGSVPIDRATLLRLERDGLFPQGHLVTPHKKLWFKDEVIKWQRDLSDPNSELSKAVRSKLAKPKGE